jgi:recombinational DNA repair protein (RecF pathway)
MRLNKFTHCFDCRKKIDLAYVSNRRGSSAGLCFECYYDIKKLNEIMKKVGV